MSFTESLCLYAQYANFARPLLCPYMELTYIFAADAMPHMEVRQHTPHFGVAASGPPYMVMA